jgi:hypothetical protein
MIMDQQKPKVTELGTVGSMKNLLKTLLQGLTRDNERWKDKEKPRNVVRDRTEKLRQIEELLKIKNWFDSKDQE